MQKRRTSLMLVFSVTLLFSQVVCRVGTPGYEEGAPAEAQEEAPTSVAAAPHAPGMTFYIRVDGGSGFSVPGSC